MSTPAKSPTRQEELATLMLVAVTLLWGMSFPCTKTWQEAARSCPGGDLLASLTLIGLRMPLAFVLLGLWQPRLIREPTGREHAAGFLLGAVFFAGFALQTWGLAYTTPALSAFFTSLCSAWVPLIAWVGFGIRAAPLTLLGLALALGGCSVLVDGWQVGPGDLLTLVCSLIFAGQMLLLDVLGRRFRAHHLSAGFLAGNATLGITGSVLLSLTGPGLAEWASWTVDMLREPMVLSSVVFLAVLPTVVAFHWMNTYQPQVSPTRAALIYLLEPVFTALFSVGVGHDQLTGPLVLGGVLILGGNVLVEVPNWLALRRRGWGGE